MGKGLRAGPGETRSSAPAGLDPSHGTSRSSHWRGGTRKQTGLPSICSRYSMEQLSTTSSIAPLARRLGRIWKTRAGGGMRGCRDHPSPPIGAKPSAHGSHRQRPLHAPLRAVRLSGPGPLRVPEGHWTDLGESPAHWPQGSGCRALARLALRVPAWPDNNYSSSGSAPHPTSSRHPSFPTPRSAL